MKAYCFRNGQIHFGKVIPHGALGLGSGPSRLLRRTVTALARWSYPTKRGGNDSVPLVPGIPEAKNDDDALTAAAAFSIQVQKRLAKKGVA